MLVQFDPQLCPVQGLRNLPQRTSEGREAPMGQTISRRHFIGTAAMAGAALSGMSNALAAAQAPD